MLSAQIGFGNLLMTIQFGTLPHDLTMNNIELLADGGGAVHRKRTRPRPRPDGFRFHRRAKAAPRDRSQTDGHARAAGTSGGSIASRAIPTSSTISGLKRVAGHAVPRRIRGPGRVGDRPTIIAEEALARKSPDFFMSYAGSVFTGLNITRNGHRRPKAEWLPKIFAGEVRMAIADHRTRSRLRHRRDAHVRGARRRRVRGQRTRSSGRLAPAPKNTVMNVYLRTDRDKNYREGMSLLLIDNDIARRAAAQARHARPALARHLRGLLQGRARAGRPCIVGGERQRLGLCPLGSAAGARLLGRAAAAAARWRRSTLRWPMPRKASIRPPDRDEPVDRPYPGRPRDRDRRGPHPGCGAPLGWFPRVRTRCAKITMAKLFASEVYVKVANAGMQIFGGYGYSMEYDMQRHFRDSRSSTIAAGTSEM